MNEIINVYKGNTVTVAVTVTNNGVAFPLAGYTCRFVAKSAKSGGSTIIDITATSGDIVDNVVTFDLGVMTGEIGNYIYECTVSKAVPVFMKTVSQGEFNIVSSIV